jgi:hypothetical protein
LGAIDDLRVVNNVMILEKCMAQSCVAYHRDKM